MWANIKMPFYCLFTGQFGRIWIEVHVRLYRATWEALWPFIQPGRRAGRPDPVGTFTRETDQPVAFESPDHIAPKGTAVNSSTNKRFVLHMDEKLNRELPGQPLRVMDLGCAGGQMVFDNITQHLEPGGYFIASTTETSDHEGLELPQTRWTNAEWRAWLAKHYPQLEYVDVGLAIYQFVRYNFPPRRSCCSA